MKGVWSVDSKGWQDHIQWQTRRDVQKHRTDDSLSASGSEPLSQVNQASPYRGMRPYFARGLSHGCHNDSSKTRLLVGITEEPLVSPSYRKPAGSNGQRGAACSTSSTAAPAVRLDSGGTTASEYNEATKSPLEVSFRIPANPSEASVRSTPRILVSDLAGTEADLDMPLRVQQPLSARTRPPGTSRRLFSTLGRSAAAGGAAPLSARTAVPAHEDIRGIRQSTASSSSSTSFGSRQLGDTLLPGWLASGSTPPSVLGTSDAFFCPPL
eukprot:TRINITY_DN29047_c0_g1_i2.p1 TRINITY_DN29047_c0_g1~~TRINITY_DN29047_c0_g1_i2.p1  ORF type:complete len:268 (-),score=33.41 TRINITY_DN29047_c0_g1_i2:356-1159(-)